MRKFLLQLFKDYTSLNVNFSAGKHRSSTPEGANQIKGFSLESGKQECIYSTPEWWKTKERQKSIMSTFLQRKGIVFLGLLTSGWPCLASVVCKIRGQAWEHAGYLPSTSVSPLLKCGWDAEDLLVKELSGRGAWTYLTWPWVYL